MNYTIYTRIGKPVLLMGLLSVIPACQLSDNNLNPDNTESSSESSTQSGSISTVLSLVSTVPAKDASSVDVASALTATFATDLDCSTVSDTSFTLENVSAAISGTVTCSGKTATFTPAANLTLEDFTATLSTDITDITGKAFTANYQWSFTTNVWTQTLGSIGHEQGLGITTDADGNVIVTGQANGSIDSQPHAGTTDMIVSKFSAGSSKQWTRILGTTSVDYGRSVATDSTGNIYVVGETLGSIDGQTYAGGSGQDIFLTKYAADGTKQWTVQHGSISTDIGFDVAVDSNNAIYIAGYVYGDIDGQTSNGATDFALIKYTSDGTHVWTRLAGTPDNNYGRYVAIDSADNVYIYGYTYGAMEGSNLGSYDAAVVKFSSDGTQQWTRQLGGTGSDYPTGLHVDSNDNIYITGSTSASYEGQSATGSWDMFASKLSSDGTTIWSMQFGSATVDFTYGSTIDSNNNVYLVGYTITGLDGQSHIGGNDIFITKFNSDGNKQWTRQYGTTNNDVGINAAASGNSIYVTGYSHGDIDGNANMGNNDIFILKLDIDGNKQ